MEDLTLEAKKDILSKLDALMHGSSKEAFRFVSNVIPEESEAKTILLMILNLFYTYYKKVNNAFFENNVFNILNIYYILFSHYIKYDENVHIHEQEEEKNNFSTA